jgi:hypothetical protein
MGTLILVLLLLGLFVGLPWFVIKQARKAMRLQKLQLKDEEERERARHRHP